MRNILSSKSFISLSVFVSIIVLMGCVEKTQENKQDSYAELVRLLGANISTIIKNNTITIEYCPDNTCESFSIPKENPKEKLNDFVFLYLYFISDYSYLDEFRKKVAQDNVAKIIQRNSQGMEKQNQLQNAKDIIKSLAETYLIKAKFVRYDERKRNEVDIDIGTHLKTDDKIGVRS